MNTEKSEKKAYVSPSMEEIDMEYQKILCGSCGDDPDCINAEIGE